MAVILVKKFNFASSQELLAKLGVGPTSPCFQMGGVQLGERKSLILAEFLYSQYCIFFVTFLFVLIDSDDMPDLQKHLETISGALVCL